MPLCLPSHSLCLQPTATKGRGTLPFPSLLALARRAVGASELPYLSRGPSLDTQNRFLDTQNRSLDLQNCSLDTQECSMDTQKCSPDTQEAPWTHRSAPRTHKIAPWTYRTTPWTHSITSSSLRRFQKLLEAARSLENLFINSFECL